MWDELGMSQKWEEGPCDKSGFFLKAWEAGPDKGAPRSCCGLARLLKCCRTRLGVPATPATGLTPGAAPQSGLSSHRCRGSHVSRDGAQVGVSV